MVVCASYLCLQFYLVLAIWCRPLGVCQPKSRPKSLLLLLLLPSTRPTSQSIPATQPSRIRDQKPRIRESKDERSWREKDIRHPATILGKVILSRLVTSVRVGWQKSTFKILALQKNRESLNLNIYNPKMFMYTLFHQLSRVSIALLCSQIHQLAKIEGCMGLSSQP